MGEMTAEEALRFSAEHIKELAENYPELKEMMDHLERCTRYGVLPLGIAQGAALAAFTLGLHAVMFDETD